ncbi:hypothetical protein ZIOFF_038162 [Zingiber officinale]|uniref:Uncharacterized protein n=3 Tax=Zingiber officinale TaxID=94328 RepID=A0A8J5L4M7_ZINOF|nr:hypothetical protein ZIOFF_038162 [Zingiber officinale]
MDLRRVATQGIRRTGDKIEKGRGFMVYRGYRGEAAENRRRWRGEVAGRGREDEERAAASNVLVIEPRHDISMVDGLRCGIELLRENGQEIITNLQKLVPFMIGLEIAGMATKVQGKNYLPGYFFLHDVKEDTSSWSGYYRDKQLSVNLNNGYIARSAFGFSEHDKVMLKQTMLEHEVIFHKQVYELHRLYKIQKDLMTEFQTKGFHGYPIVPEVSHSNPFATQIGQECPEKKPQMAHFIGNTNHGKTPLAGIERFHFSSRKEGSVHSSPISLFNGVSEKDDKELDYLPRKRRKFDLQLPADVYIDIDDTEGSNKKNFSEHSYSAKDPKNGACSLYFENDVKLSLGSTHKEDHNVVNSPIHTNMSTDIVNLNAPTTDVDFGGPSDSASVQFLGSRMQSQWNKLHHSSVRSYTSISDGRGDQLTTSDYLYTDVDRKRGWPGKHRSTTDFLARTSDSENMETSQGTLPLNTSTRTNVMLPFDRNSPEIWPGPKLSDRFSNSVLMSPQVPASIKAKADVVRCAPSSVSSWRKPSTSTKDKPVTVQSLPSLCRSLNHSKKSLSLKTDDQIPITCEKRESIWHLTASLEPVTFVSHTNILHLGLHNDDNETRHSNLLKDHQNGYLRRDLKTSKNMNLNESYRGGIKGKHSYLADNKYSKLSEGPSWFSNTSLDESDVTKKHASRVDVSLSNEHMQLESSADAEIFGRKNREKIRNQINLNVEFACVDGPMPLEELHDCEVVTSSHSAPIFDAKMCSLSKHKQTTLSKKDGSEEQDPSGDSLRLAAQNLIALSMDCHGSSDGITPSMLEPSSDNLSWFAEVVFCSAEDPKICEDNGFDLFETMTLNLKEVKTNRCWPKESEKKDETKERDSTGAASMLFTKPRRGQARKRRQKRDFQKDILPGLASLSRHEVTEDLQNIGRMVKASGKPWKTGITRRNKCLNGATSQTSYTEIRDSERSLIGWGKTTRRCHRPRCPPGTLPTLS